MSNGVEQEAGNIQGDDRDFFEGSRNATNAKDAGRIFHVLFSLKSNRIHGKIAYTIRVVRW